MFALTFFFVVVKMTKKILIGEDFCSAGEQLKEGKVREKRKMKDEGGAVQYNEDLIESGRLGEKGGGADRERDER